MDGAIAESRVAVEAADLNGVKTTRSRRRIVRPGIRWELELAGDMCDHAPRRVVDLGEEGAQESQGADLDGEAEHGGISPAMACVPEILRVEVEEPIELLDTGFPASLAARNGSAALGAASAHR